MDIQEDVSRWVREVKEARIKFIAISVGRSALSSKLEELATTDKDVFTVDSFDNLHSIASNVALRACEGETFN